MQVRSTSVEWECLMHRWAGQRWRGMGLGQSSTHGRCMQLSRSNGKRRVGDRGNEEAEGGGRNAGPRGWQGAEAGRAIGSSAGGEESDTYVNGNGRWAWELVGWRAAGIVQGVAVQCGQTHAWREAVGQPGWAGAWEWCANTGQGQCCSAVGWRRRAMAGGRAAAAPGARAGCPRCLPSRSSARTSCAAW